MRFYQEITLIKTPEISPYFIWSKLYTQLHLALVEQQNPDKTVDIGVSFPEYTYQEKEGKRLSSLGIKLRVFASSEQELQQLGLNKWLDRLIDYVHIKSTRPVPENITSFLLVKRYRAKTNLSLERTTRRLARRNNISIEQAKTMQHERFAREHNVSLEEAEKHYLRPETQSFPFIKVKSYSGDREFSLQIEQVESNKPQQGAFSTYGLSSTTTVPHW